MTGPLDGIRVLDFTRALAGPYCTLMLGDLGADVIKVEVPGRGDDTRQWGPPFIGDESVYFMSVSRNKRSVTVNLKDERGKEIIRRLAARCDVLCENFSPGTMDRLGLGYEELRQVNPRLIYSSISGFGQDGPAFKRPAYDVILQGMGGVMSITGEPDGPPTKVGVPIGDINCGMFAAYATVSALFHRERTGEGQRIDSSMLAGQVTQLVFLAGGYFATGEVPGRLGNFHPTLVPYGTYPTRDGYVNIAVGNNTQWRAFCEALDLQRLLADERLKDNSGRKGHRAEVTQAIVDRLRDLTTAEVVAILEKVSVPCGPIYDIKQVFDDPQSQHLGMRQRIQHPTVGEISVTGHPSVYSATPASIRIPPPTLGQHTNEVLAWLGYSREEIAALRADEVI